MALPSLAVLPSRMASLGGMAHLVTYLPHDDHYLPTCALVGANFAFLVKERSFLVTCNRWKGFIITLVVVNSDSSSLTQIVN